MRPARATVRAIRGAPTDPGFPASPVDGVTLHYVAEEQGHTQAGVA